jgi:putative N6-adenine-specific DNA methylase
LENGKHTIVVKTFAGLEQVLSNELKAIGAEEIKVLNRAVSIKGDDEVLYKANYLCRTALRVLVLIDTFKISNEEDLYNRIAKTNWSKYMDVDHTFAIDANVYNSVLTHTKYAALKMKDAIVDQFRRKFNTRPDVETKHPDFRLSIHIESNNCSLYIDSSGNSLSRRGYRVAANEAPMNEVLASGLIKLAKWDCKSNFIDPMCGSGTILIEAAMMACNIPAGYYRRYFSFINWKNFNADIWKKIISESEANIIEPDCRIIGSDISNKSIEIAKQNIKRARLHYDIELKQVSIQDSEAPEDKGFVLTNPPYDERLEIEDATVLYEEIGDTLKNKYQGCTAWMITSNRDALRFVGLATSKRISVFNGALECDFVKYDLYEGTKKISRRDIDFKPFDSRRNNHDYDSENMTRRREEYRMKHNKENSEEGGDFRRGDRKPRGDFRRDDRRSGGDFRKDDRKPRGDFRRDDRRTGGDFRRDDRKPRGDFRRDDRRSGGDLRKDDRKPRGDFRRDDRRSGGDFRKDDRKPRGDFRRDDRRSGGDFRKDDRKPRGDFRRDDRRSGGDFRRDDRKPRGDFRRDDRRSGGDFRKDGRKSFDRKPKFENREPKPFRKKD